MYNPQFPPYALDRISNDKKMHPQPEGIFIHKKTLNVEIKKKVENTGQNMEKSFII